MRFSDYTLDSPTATQKQRHTTHSREDDQAGDEHMPSLAEWLVLEEIVFDDFSADIVFERDCMVQLPHVDPVAGRALRP
jgi:hypothetical protein